jgi:hypothetical protein
MANSTKKTKKELEQEVATVKEQLKQRSAEVQSMAAGAAINAPQMVPIKNYGGTLVFIPFEWNGVHRTVVLEASGPRSVGSLPYDVWLQFEGEDIVKLGYVARTDEPTDNPNVIEDIEEFFKTSTEKEVKERLANIVNPNVIWRLIGYVQSVPRRERSGKMLVMSDLVIDRLRELTGVAVSDEEIE